MTLIMSLSFIVPLAAAPANSPSIPTTLLTPPNKLVIILASPLNILDNPETTDVNNDIALPAGPSNGRNLLA
jgi:hypothetical protein